MEVVINPSVQYLADLAAKAVDTLLRSRGDAVLGLLSGASPLAVYEALVRRHHETGLSFAQARGFLLDEYVGLPPNAPESNLAVINQQFVSRVDFAPGAVQAPDGRAEDLAAACTDYERAITEAGGIDLQLLGIGIDGHVAFNEPGSSLASRTRVKALTEQTRRDDSRFLDEYDIDSVPRYMITQGLGTIMEARHIVLLAFGQGKAEAVQHLVEGPVSALWPGSVLQYHPHLSVLIDDAAASRLQLADFYRHAWANKPSWQGL